jgi:hypothetical protein
MVVSSHLDEILRRVQGDFLEMPGLRLTADQAQRLWNLDRLVCEALLEALIDAHFLVRLRDGAVMRADSCDRPQLRAAD